MPSRVSYSASSLKAEIEIVRRKVSASRAKACILAIEERVIAPFPVVRVQGAAISQPPEVPSSSGCRPVGPPVRQGAVRPPWQAGPWRCPKSAPKSVSSPSDTKRNPITIRQGTVRAPWQAGPWRCPKSAPKSVSSPSDPKHNPVTTKMRLVNPTSATTVRPSSRTAPPKAKHPGTCTNSRGKAAAPVVKALPSSPSDPKCNPVTTKMRLVNPTSATTVRPSSRTAPPKAKHPGTRCTSKPEPRNLTRGKRPVGTNPVVQALPRRQREIENILPPRHSTSFLSSTPLLPMSAEIIAHAHTPNIDMESGPPLKSFASCTPSRGRVRRSPFRPCRGPRQKVPLASVRCDSLLLSPRQTAVPSHLVVDAEGSISDSADIIDCLEEMEDLLHAMQADLVDGWAAKMEAMGLRSMLP